MAFNRDITTQDITDYGIISAPDTLTGTASENKTWFDKLVTYAVKVKHNGLIDDLEAETAAENLGFAESTNIPYDNIQDAIDYLYSSGSAGVAKAVAEALKAEGYGVGKQNGSDVGSTSPYYHNNAKYFSENCDAQATSATNSATSASNSATTAQEKATSASGSASTATTKASEASSSASLASQKANEASGYAGTASTAANTATSKATEAAASATSASTSATTATTGANTATEKATQAYVSAAAAEESSTTASTAATTATTGATTATTNALKAEGYGVGKQNGEDVGTSSPYYHNNAKYFSEHMGGDTMAFGTDDIVEFSSGSNADHVVANPATPGTTPLKGLQVGTEKYICGTHLTIGGVDYLLRTSTEEAGLAGYITFVVGE